MRAIIGAACLLASSALPALGADTGGPIKLDDLQAPPAKHNRSALYIGAVAGLTTAQLQAEPFEFADTSWLAGGFAGINIRVPDSPFVVGIEGDYLLTDVHGSAGNGVVTVTASTNYLASVRARAGVGIGPALLYVTGGPAFTESKVAAGGPTDKETLVGAALGMGAEAELTKVLFLRLEAMHYVFPDQDLSCGLACLAESKDQQTTVRLGLGFKLN